MLGHAPDFPSETAGTALKRWVSAPGGHRRLDPALVEEELHLWSDMVERIEGPQRR